MTGRPSSDRFYNEATLDEALKKADQALMQMSKNNRMPVNAQVQINGDNYIGVRGKLWALLLLERHQNDQRLTPQGINVIAQNSLKKIGENVTKNIEKLKLYFSASSKDAADKNIELMEKVFPQTVDIVCQNLNGRLKDSDPSAASIDQLMINKISDSCLNGNFKTIREAYKGIRDVLDGRGGEYTGPVNVTDGVNVSDSVKPSVSEHQFLQDHTCEMIFSTHPSYNGKVTYSHYLDEESSQENKVSEDLHSRLTSPYSKSRVYFLHGNIHAGKSEIITELLRYLRKDSNKKSLKTLCLTTIDELYLPVFQVNVKSNNSKSLLREILVFLERLECKASKGLDDIRKGVDFYIHSHSYANSPQLLLERIRELHAKNPAFFIFQSWEDMDRGLNRIILHESVKNRLIHVLRDSNSDSRIVISALNATKGKIKGINADLHGVEPIRVQNPSFKQIKRYFPKGQYPAAFENILNGLAHEFRVKRITGERLLLISLAIDLSILGDAECQEVLKGILNRLKDDPTSEDFNGVLYSFIIGVLDDWGILKMIFRIASSDDGLRQETLELIHNGTLDLADSCDTVSFLEVFRKLKGLVHVANGFFLRAYQKHEDLSDELDVDERHSSDDLTLELDPTLAKMIFHYVDQNAKRTDVSEEEECVWQKRKAMLLQAHRDIAITSRFRSQIKRQNTDTMMAPMSVKCIERDVQSYEAILASLPYRTLLDPQEVEELRRQSPLLSDSSDCVFTNSENFNPAIALRYAVKCILRRDIDGRDHNMSMLFDQDRVRLRLYLLLAFPVGIKHFWRINDLCYSSKGQPKGDKVALPEELPLHLRNCFDERELIDWLTTVAITAFHCQKADIIRWAMDRAGELVEIYSDDRKLVFKSVRIWGSYFDSCIVRGTTRLKAKRKGQPGDGHEGTLELVKSHLQAYYTEVEDLYKECDGSVERFREFLVEEENHLQVKSWMRLKVREAELLSLLGGEDNIKTAEYIYDVVGELEKALASKRGNDHPVVLSGRTGRQYLRFLLRLQEGGDAEWCDISGKVQSIIDVNTARLGRFGGADRATLFIDRARLEYFKHPKDLRKAMLLAQEAFQLCENGTMSRAIRMEALQVYLHLCILDLEQNAPIEGTERERDEVILSQIARLEADANLVGYGPVEAIAGYLRARLELMIYHAKNKEIKNDESALGQLKERLACAYGSIEKAIEKMEACKDRTFSAKMNEVKAGIGSILQL